MAKIKQAVFDAGPFIHLNEVEQLALLELFLRIHTTPYVLDECKKIQDVILKKKNVSVDQLKPQSKDFSKYLCEKYELDLGECTAIALCRQKKIKHFFTDDLHAREIAASLGFKPHGTLAIVLRSLRENMLDKKQAKNIIESLYQDSTLFLTRDLRDWTLQEIEKFRQLSKSS